MSGCCKDHAELQSAKPDGAWRIDHFTVVAELPGLWLEARLAVRPCFDTNLFALHDKNSEVCINTRSPAASLPFIGRVTEKTTVKWSIGNSLKNIGRRTTNLKLEQISNVIM